MPMDDYAKKEQARKDRGDFYDYEIESATQTLIRAQEIRDNPKLMAKVLEKAQETLSNVKDVISEGGNKAPAKK